MSLLEEIPAVDPVLCWRFAHIASHKKTWTNTKLEQGKQRQQRYVNPKKPKNLKKLASGIYILHQYRYQMPPVIRTRLFFSSNKTKMQLILQSVLYITCG